MAFGLAAGASIRLPPTNPLTFTGVGVNISNASPTTIYTVAAGRKLYITQIQTGTSTSASSFVVWINSDAVIQIGLAANSSTAVGDYPLIVVEAGQLLKVSTNSANMNYIISGFLL